MAAATTTDQFIDLLRKSGLVEATRLDAFLATISDSIRENPRSLADTLVRQGFLTPFQAGQIISGKWRGFFIASGKYKLLQLLGVGGMGRVYLCEHLRMRRLVALKVLPEDQTKDQASIERFNREAQAAAALNHPNIVRAYDIDQDGPMHFLVMEYVDGASLQDMVRKHGPFDIHRVCHYISQAAVGLQHASEAGWVHRDIKPGNLLLDRTGTVKILDMGLARLFETADNDKLTQKFDNKAVLGTADYLAPEQAVNSSDVDIRADIYSLGATMYYLLTGKAPFEDGTVTQKLLAHQNQDPISTTTIRPDVPRPIDAIVKKMMAKKPVNRYQTPNEIVEALLPWTDLPIEPPADEEMSRLCPALVGYSTVSSTSIPISGIQPSPSGKMRKPLSGSRSSSYLLRNGVGEFPFARWARRRPGLLLGICIGVVTAFWAVMLGIWQPWNRWGNSDPSKPLPPLASVPTVEPATKSNWAPAPVRSEKPAAQTVYVSQTPQPSVTGRSPVYPTFAQALENVSAGTRLVVLDELIESNLVMDDPTKFAGVVIEAAYGQPVTWQPTSDSGTVPVIEIRGVPNVRLKGFTFKGGPRTAALIRVHGSCPGLRLDDLKFTDFPGTALEFTGADPSADDPMVVQRVRFMTVRDYSAAGRDKASEVRPAALTVAVSRAGMPGGPSLVVRESRFEGLYQTAIEITGPIAAEFYRNRFFTLRDDERPATLQSCDAFFWQPGPAQGMPRLMLASNTVARYPNFLRLAKLPAGKADTGRVDMRSNLMVGGATWATGPTHGDDPAVKSLLQGAGNVARPNTCMLGYHVPKKFVAFKNIAMSMDDEHFLRYPKRSPEDGRPHELVNAGAEGEPAGYPPSE